MLHGAGAAFAQSCVVDGPRYHLTQDSVNWSMNVPSGGSCIRGIRFSDVAIESLKLISPPKSGDVALRGSGFIYTAKSGFRGEDAFSLVVQGSIDKARGNSTINIAVSVVDPQKKATARDGSRPFVTITEPASGATVSGSSVTLSAKAFDDAAIASVRFIVDSRTNAGSMVTSPPYSVTWNSNSVADGSHRLYAVARDTFGNYATSSIGIVVKNRRAP